MRRLPLLLACGSLALGEFLASLLPGASPAWPVLAAAVVLVGLLGYGCSMRGWPYVCIVLTGAVIYLVASSGKTARDRERPWMVGRAREGYRAAETTGIARTVRRNLSGRIALGLDRFDETVALSRAILLGERQRLPWRTKKVFTDSGTMHVFAISGLHVMAIAEVLSVVLTLFFLPQRLAGVLAIPLLWGYVHVIGLAPSAVRAATMATFSLVAPVFWRKPDGLRSWCLTFLAVHLVDPLLIANVGNALSFSVMLAIMLASDFAREMPGWKRSLFVTFAAWAIGLPISAHVFGLVTPGGMLANLVLIGTAKMAVVAGATGILASFVSDTLAAHLNNLTALGIRLMVLVSDLVARLPGSNFETGQWSYLTCVEWYVALGLGVFLLLRIRSRPQ